MRQFVVVPYIGTWIETDGSISVFCDEESYLI